MWCADPRLFAQQPDQPFNCTSCFFDGFKEVNGSCVPMSEGCAEGCLECQSGGYCLKCKDGFKIESIMDGTCVESALLNCSVAGMMET